MRTLALAGVLGLCATNAHAQVRVEMRADRSSMTLDELAIVRIEVETQGGGSPEVELPSFAGFEVVNQRVERPMQFSFNFGSGAVFRSATNYAFQLRPLQVGRLRIDPVRVTVDGRAYASGSVEITIAAGGQGPPGQAPSTAPPPGVTSPDPGSANAPIDETAFLTLVADDPAPYLGQQVTVTALLYVRRMLRSAPAVAQEPGTAGFWTQDLLPPAHTLQAQRQIVQGRAYSMYVLRRFAAFPLRTGRLEIGPMTIRLDQSSVLDLLSGQLGGALERTAPPITLEVRPLPELDRPAGEVAVGRFDLSAALDRQEVATGDAVTLKAVVRGEGNPRTVRLETPVLAGVDVLAPEIKDLPQAHGDAVGGEREVAWLLVPKVPGEHVVPPIELHTFDPLAERYLTLATQPLTLRAVGNALADAPASPEATDTEPATRAADIEAIEWAPLRAESALLRESARLVESPAYALALALPPFGWLGLVVGSLVRRRLARRAAEPQQRALRDARRHLADAQTAARAGDRASFHAAAAAAVTAVLTARTGAEIAGLTRPELRALVTRVADAELASAVSTRLDRADVARFGIGDGSALPEEAEALRVLFDRLEALAPVASEDAA